MHRQMLSNSRILRKLQIKVKLTVKRNNRNRKRNRNSVTVFTTITYDLLLALL